MITDEATGAKYPLADYQLLPNMAIIDTDLMMSQPRGLTAASGIDAMVHALEAYASVMATDFTDGLALKALKNIFTYLRSAMKTANMHRWHGKRWRMLPPWQVWRLPMPFWVCALYGT